MIKVFVKTQEDMSEASITLLQDTSCSVINFSLKVRAVLISSAFFFFFIHVTGNPHLHLTTFTLQERLL